MALKLVAGSDLPPGILRQRDVQPLFVEEELRRNRRYPISAAIETAEGN